jgi:hypothetical protein
MRRIRSRCTPASGCNPPSTSVRTIGQNSAFSRPRRANPRPSQVNSSSGLRRPPSTSDPGRYTSSPPPSVSDSVRVKP